MLYIHGPEVLRSPGSFFVANMYVPNYINRLLDLHRLSVLASTLYYNACQSSSVVYQGDRQPILLAGDGLF